jgi:hypothetical protein
MYAMSTTTANGKRVTIQPITVGQNFGTAVVVKAANGRIIHETEPVGLGFVQSAVAMALRWCAAN